VPVSSKLSTLSVALMQQLFVLGKGRAPCRHITLAVVDDDGSVSLMRLFNYIQAPLEGPDAMHRLEEEQAGDVVGGEPMSEDDEVEGEDEAAATAAQYLEEEEEG
jgi:hypothetical protein